MYDEVTVLVHSSIRITGDKTIYFDPYNIEENSKDADFIFITHDHYDHFSPKDIEKIKKEATMLVMPASMEKQAAKTGISDEHTMLMLPGEAREINGISVEAVAAYNTLKPFHTKGKQFLGYVVTMNQTRYYIAGDTDINDENKQVKCDVAVVPVGGMYTMDAKEAAKLVNIIKPQMAIPSHYGSVVGSMKDADRFLSLVDKEIACRK
ncbi:MAG: MBL fold metallo-hydrolase [Clostridium sp.]|nr:MBL fold metallo-hydrolase [Clostridium sp.]MCM1172922.1 MBL fold metallo-hydrolase [Clostridium sp.]MCM1208588.1 MBL fold metallo-hydrolase [Ruminococcus sp.]